jgi:Tol biopolymer transport system component
MPEYRARTASAFFLVVASLIVSTAAAQESQISFTTTEGTWISLDVAPDGSSVLFELLGDVYQIPVDGGRARAILSGSAFQSQPRFSPDGEHVAYISDETGADNVWIARSNGTEAHAITTLQGATLISPAWSSDGASVYVTVASSGMQRAAEIWRYPVTGGEGERVVENANGAGQPLPVLEEGAMTGALPGRFVERVRAGR